MHCHDDSLTTIKIVIQFFIGIYFFYLFFVKKKNIYIYKMLYIFIIFEKSILEIRTKVSID